MATPAQWFEGARPRTLPAAVAPVAAGTGAAAAADGFRLGYALLALLVAVVQPVDWKSAPDVESLRAFAADALEPAALPREVVMLGLLPVLDSGKPDKVAVRTLLRDRT